MAIHVKVDGLKDGKKKLTHIFDKTKDFRPLFEVLASDFYKTEKNMVFVASPGQYTDLKPRTKEQKLKATGRIYPMLVWSGMLKQSLTERNSPSNVTKIKQKEMSLGTKLKYSEYLFTGTKKMAKRQPVIVDLFIKRWDRTISTYYSRVVRGE